MTNLFVLTQNLVLNSLKRYQSISESNDINVFLTTHLLFENEREFISSIFPNCKFRKFADFLTDNEMAQCDIDAYSFEKIEYFDYLSDLKKRKNTIVAKKVIKEYSPEHKYILCNDLGIDYSVWKNLGFKSIKGDYYYTEHISLKKRARMKLARFKVFKSVYKSLIRTKKTSHILLPEEVYVAHYEGRKYVFLGKMSRIGYRLDVNFISSKEECSNLNAGIFESKEICTYMTTWHEHGKCIIPDDDKYAVRWAQDGYLPPNYSHKDYFFKPSNVVYYCWDSLGTNLFRNQNLPFEMIPFRKKLYLPEPVFPLRIKNILIVASGSGDWTALKNRSDDDLMVDAFVQIARQFPNIHFTYRCHPTWVHPQNVGVNAINRVNDYFNSTGLTNLTLSSNIPLANDNGEFQLSFSRSSLDEDLKNADFVFGEHSISMIDAAFRKIPFCSVNLTQRRDFFIGITELGFPSVTSLEGISDIINNVTSDSFKKQFNAAVKKYNLMTSK